MQVVVLLLLLVVMMMMMMVFVVRGQASSSLPQAGDRLHKLKEKLSEINGRRQPSVPGFALPSGLSPQHITQTWDVWQGADSNMGTPNQDRDGESPNSVIQSHNTDIQNHNRVPQNHNRAPQNFEADFLPHERTPMDHIVDLHNFDIDHQSHDIDSHAHKLDTQAYKVDPQSYKVDPHTHNINSQALKINPQIHKLDIQGIKIDPASHHIVPQSFNIDPESPRSGPQTQEGAPQRGNESHNQALVELKKPWEKLQAIRNKLVQNIVQEARLLPSNNQSIMSIAFLAFGVILFDVLGDAMFGGPTNLLAALGGSRTPPTARETLLPGLGIFGDNVNNLAEVALNMITIYLYRDESPDCGERLLCESNQQAVSRGLLDSLVTYVSGFLVSFFLHEAPLSRNLKAMRAGRKGQHCVELYPSCSISL